MLDITSFSITEVSLVQKLVLITSQVVKTTELDSEASTKLLPKRLHTTSSHACHRTSVTVAFSAMPVLLGLLRRNHRYTGNSTILLARVHRSYYNHDRPAQARPDASDMSTRLKIAT